MSYEFPSFILAIIGVLIALYILAEQRILRRNIVNDKIDRENHAKEEIYRVFRSIRELRRNRERIRTMNPQERPDVNLNTETLFMSGKLSRVIESLQFVLLVHGNYLSQNFIGRVNDAINGYDFILQRLEQFPLENDDPGNILGGDIEGFIEELREID